MTTLQALMQMNETELNTEIVAALDACLLAKTAEDKSIASSHLRTVTRIAHRFVVDDGLPSLADIYEDFAAFVEARPYLQEDDDLNTNLLFDAEPINLEVEL